MANDTPPKIFTTSRDIISHNKSATAFNTMSTCYPNPQIWCYELLSPSISSSSFLISSLSSQALLPDSDTIATLSEIINLIQHNTMQPTCEYFGEELVEISITLYVDLWWYLEKWFARMIKKKWKWRSKSNEQAERGRIRNRQVNDKLRIGLKGQKKEVFKGTKGRLEYRIKKREELVITRWGRLLRQKIGFVWIFEQ